MTSEENPSTDGQNTRLARARQRWQRLPPVARVVIATLLAVILLFLLKPGAPTRQVDDLDARVHWEAARPGRFSPELRLFGRVQSPANATLTATVMTDVLATPVLAGSRVTEGDLLVRLDPREVDMLLDQQDAELQRALAARETARLTHQGNLDTLALEEELAALSEQQLRRLERLRNDNMASQTQLDEARQNLARARLTLRNRQLAVDDHDNEMARLDAQIRRARAARDQAALDLERTTIRAPFDGRIANLHVAPGERVRPGEPLVNLYSDQGLEVQAQIPTRFLPAVRDGLDQGSLAGHALLEGRRLPLRLDRLAGLVAAGRGGVDGFFVIEGSTDGALPEIGRNLEIVLALPERDSLLAVPATALHGLDRLYLINEDNTLRSVRVQRVGEWRDADDHRHLLVHGDALRPGQRIMTTQLPGAIDGLHVIPVSNGQTPLPGEEHDSPAPEPDTGIGDGAAGDRQQ